MGKFQGKFERRDKGGKGPGGAKKAATKKKSKPRSSKNQIRGIERLLKKVKLWGFITCQPVKQGTTQTSEGAAPLVLLCRALDAPPNE